MLSGPDREQSLAVLHGLAVLDVALDDLAFVLGGDLVHQLHRLDDAEHLVFADRVTDFDEGGSIGVRRAVERADDRGLDDGELDLAVVLSRMARRRRRQRRWWQAPARRGAAAATVVTTGSAPGAAGATGAARVTTCAPDCRRMRILKSSRSSSNSDSSCSRTISSSCLISSKVIVSWTLARNRAAGISTPAGHGRRSSVLHTPPLSPTHRLQFAHHRTRASRRPVRW